MRVAIVTHRAHPAQGGVETYVYHLSKGLMDDGHQVTLYTTDLYSYQPFTKIPRTVKRGLDGVETRTYWATKPLGGIGATAISPLMVKDLCQGGFDVIHAQNYVYFPAYASALATILTKIPLVLTTHASPKTVCSRSIRRIYDFTLGRFALDATNHLIALTTQEKTYLQALGVPKEKITVIPHGILLKKYMTLPQPNDFRETYGIESRVILYVGRLAPHHKGLPYLVKAFAQVIREVSDVTLVLVGPDAGIKTELIKLSRRLGINKQIVLTGPVADETLIKAYHACDLFVLPSTFEPFGIVLLEAMAAGAPIVASNVDGIPEVITHGENGLLVTPRDVAGLTNAIATILQQPNQAKRFTHNNIIKVLNYSLEKTLHATENVYSKALQSTK